MKVLVTGVTGRIGRNFARAMVNEGREVRGLVLPGDPGLESARDDGVDCIVGNLRDLETAREAVSGVDAVMHLGASMLWGSEDYNPDLFEDNTRGTFNLAHAASRTGVHRFVFASSDEAYPSLFAKYLPIDENHPREPYSFYGLTKITGEETLRYYHRSAGLPIAIARFALVLEPWEAITPDGTLGRFLFLSTMKTMVEARSGESGLSALGNVAESDGRLLLARDAEGVPYMFHCVDVRDIVQGLRLLLDHESAVGEVFNLSGPAPFSYAEVIPYLSQKIDREFLEANIPGPPIRVHHSTAKARSLVGYQPQFDIFRTIDDAVFAK